MCQVRPPRSGSGAEGRNTRRVRPPHSTRDRLKEAAVTRGEHIMAPSQLRHYNVDLQQYKTDPVYQSKSSYSFPFLMKTFSRYNEVWTDS